MTPWQDLAMVARQQFGLVATWQAEQLGIGRNALSRYAATKGWHRARHGVYLMAGHSLEPLAQVKAAELAFHDEGLASHRAAAFVWDLLPRLYRPVEFVVAPDCSRRPKGTLVRASSHVGQRPGAVKRGIRVTAPDWTICGLSAVLNPPRLREVIATAHRKRLVTPAGVRRAADALGKFKGCADLRRALDESDALLVHSRDEALARRLLRAAGFVPHPAPYVVEDDRGLVAELDIAFPAERVGVPVNGPHHFFADQRRSDDDQRHRLRQLGWEVVPVDPVRLREQPAVFIRQVGQALELQRRRQNRGSVTHT